MDYGLSPQQLAVICALSSGATTIAAAEQAGVHRNTINNWRRNSPPFQHGFAQAQYDRALFFREKTEDLIDLAFKSLQEILADPATPASVRLKAALAIIQTASTPPEPRKQVELDIEKIVSRRGPAETVTEAQLAPAPPDTQVNPQVAPAPSVHNSAQPETVAPAPPTAASPAPDPRLAPAPPVHNPAQAETVAPDPSTAASPAPDPRLAPEPVHNSAQPTRTTSVKIGRNDPCPCGSGQKYKRCCLNKRGPLATAA